MFDLIELLWNGFQMIGQALAGIVQAVLSFFNLELPTWSIQLATGVILLGVILKYGKYVSKVILIVLLVVLASILFNLLL